MQRICKVFHGFDDKNLYVFVSVQDDIHKLLVKTKLKNEIEKGKLAYCDWAILEEDRNSTLFEIILYFRINKTMIQ